MSNASRQTIHAAQGVYLWAKVQDLPPHGVRYAEAKAEFEAWACRSSVDMVELVQAVQYRLFDQVNAL